MKRVLLGLVTLGLAVGLLLLWSGLGGTPRASAQPPDPHYKCYDIVGTDPDDAVDLETQFGVESGVDVGQATKLCLPAGMNGQPIPDAPHLKCYTIAGQDPPDVVNLTTQFGVQEDVAVGQATRLCVPAAKTLLPATPEPTPPSPTVHYECFNIVGSDPSEVVQLETQFGVESGVEVGQATELCAPALKDAEGDLNATHLKCHDITGSPPGPNVNLTTQFGIEEGVVVGAPSMLCAPAIKEVLTPTPTLTPTDTATPTNTATPTPTSTPYTVCGNGILEDPPEDCDPPAVFSAQCPTTSYCDGFLWCEASYVGRCTNQCLCEYPQDRYLCGCDVQRCGAECATDDDCPGSLRCSGPPFCACSVGGTAELPRLDAPSAEEAAAPGDGSGWSPTGYAALAGGLAAAAITLGAGGWYVRRRWIR